ncbi:MAG TPA: pitrilysin family protein [Pseudolabrys sp.]|nr:pitrilysin family protein [Pseudolabrys sp.]
MSARRGFLALVGAGLLMLMPSLAHAVAIERIVSPSGIEAWLVREPAVPIIALNFSFAGGASQDTAEKAGTASLTTNMLDEGAGDLDSSAFHQRLERRAIEMSFSVGRDFTYGSLRTLNDNRDEATELLRLALNAPRFDAEPLERVRGQVLSMLRRASTDPNSLASRRWWATAFPGHPYGRESRGTLESVATIAADDLRDFTRRVFARDGLKIAIVGDIDAKAAGEMVDRVFGSLPAKGDLRPVPDVTMTGLGTRGVIDVDVPQAVVIFGAPGLARNDKDFMAGYIANHILGGGTFSSRLYNEVREKRGLAYGVSQSLVWFKHSAVVIGGTQVRADRTGDALSIIEQEVKRMGEAGPTAEELAKAKSYLKGSYILGLDTSTKIASQLIQIQNDNLGMDYMTRRDALIDAVTLDDVRRVSKRLFSQGLLVTVAGRPKGVTSVGQ